MGRNSDFASSRGIFQEDPPARGFYVNSQYFKKFGALPEGLKDGWAINHILLIINILGRFESKKNNPLESL